MVRKAKTAERENKLEFITKTLQKYYKNITISIDNCLKM